MKETESSQLFVHFEQKIWAKSADGVRLDLKRLLQCSLGFLTLQEHVFFIIPLINNSLGTK